MTTQIDTALELDDIQAAALMPRPNPYAGTYVAVRIDDRHAGRELLRRLIPLLDPVATFDPARPVSLGVGLSYSGLEALGVPEQSLASFPAEFRQGMAARADYIGDVGENAPEHWEAALGSKDVHVVAAALARDTSLMETLVMLAQDAIRDLPGVAPIWALDVHIPPDGREQFGFKDSISEPAVEGTNILAATGTRHRLRPASSSWATRTRTRASTPSAGCRMRRPSRSGARARTWCGASSTRTAPRPSGCSR